MTALIIVAHSSGSFDVLYTYVHTYEYTTLLILEHKETPLHHLPRIFTCYGYAKASRQYPRIANSTQTLSTAAKNFSSIFSIRDEREVKQ